MCLSDWVSSVCIVVCYVFFLFVFITFLLNSMATNSSCIKFYLFFILWFLFFIVDYFVDAFSINNFEIFFFSHYFFRSIQFLNLFMMTFKQNRLIHFDKQRKHNQSRVWYCRASRNWFRRKTVLIEMLFDMDSASKCMDQLFILKSLSFRLIIMICIVTTIYISLLIHTSWNFFQPEIRNDLNYLLWLFGNMNYSEKKGEKRSNTLVFSINFRSEWNQKRIRGCYFITFKRKFVNISLL